MRSHDGPAGTEGLILVQNRASAPRPSGFPPVTGDHVLAQRVRVRADQPLPKEDPAAILAIQQSILARLHEGRYFFTAHHEGGTHIKWIRDRFVFQDYGESDDREEFTALDCLIPWSVSRHFYDWRALYDWLPHAPPEIEAWRFIERELG